MVLENVRNLKSHDGGRTFKVIMGAWRDDLGYFTTDATLDAKDFGCACKRSRVFVVCFRDKEDAENFSFYPFGWQKEKAKPIKSCLLPSELIPENAWLSQVALDGLKKHRKRHEEAGNGWGYVVLSPRDPANTFSTSGNSSEHNLIVDKASHRNSDHLRVLLPRERARAMGFPDSFALPDSRDLGNIVVGNSVAIPVVKHLLSQVDEVIA